MSRRGRSKTSLRRRPPRYEPRACVLVVCEGAKTEPQYFNGLRHKLRLSTLEVEVVGKECGSAPVSVVREAVRLRKERLADHLWPDYDEIWCVIDVEAPQPHATLQQALRQAADNGLNVALSNPCFEYWYVLHFERVGSSFNSKAEVVRRLKKHLPRYRESDEDVFETVYPHTDKAIKNAKNVLGSQWQSEDDPVRRNPSTDVFSVVERLREIGTKPYQQS
jgi:hypothetical protein